MLRINGSLIKVGNSLLDIPGAVPVTGYSRFMLKISGFYSTRSWQNPARYIQWDEVGVGWNGLGPFYGPDYWSLESYGLHDATDWGDRTGTIRYLFDGYWGDAGGYNSKFDATYDVGCENTWYGEVIFTSLNGPIDPDSMGFYAPLNIQSHPQVPGLFELYGWNGTGWVLIAAVNGSQLSLINNECTVVTF